MALIAVAVATALVYAVWTLWVPLLPENLYVPLLDLGKITGYRWPAALLFLQLVIGLYVLYGIGYWLVSRGKGHTALIFGAGFVFCAELVWAYPATAVDVFGYVAHGRLLALHSVNPFTVVPAEFPGDAIMPYLAFPTEPSQYGPIWVLIGGALATLSHGDLLTEVLLYKVVAALAHIAGAVLIFQIARRLGAHRDRARASAYLYLWNPMLLWEMVGNAHNDGVMMLFGLVAAWLFVAGADLLVLPAVVAGALVKVPVVLIAPLLFIGVVRRSPARAFEGALLAIALAAVIYRPFWEGLNTFTALRRTDLFTASLGSVLRLSLMPGLWFQAWYVVWPFAIGAALAEPRRHLEVALLSLGGLLQYFVFIYLWVMGYFPQDENLAVQSAAYFCIVAPLLLGVLIVRSSTPHRSRIYRRA